MTCPKFSLALRLPRRAPETDTSIVRASCKVWSVPDWHRRTGYSALTRLSRRSCLLWSSKLELLNSRICFTLVRKAPHSCSVANGPNCVARCARGEPEWEVSMMYHPNLSDACRPVSHPVPSKFITAPSSARDRHRQSGLSYFPRLQHRNSGAPGARPVWHDSRPR